MTTNDAGPLFDCDPGIEQITVFSKPLKSHVIINRFTGQVLTALSESQVSVSPYTGDDNQYWIWHISTGRIQSEVNYQIEINFLTDRGGLVVLEVTQFIQYI